MAVAAETRQLPAAIRALSGPDFYAYAASVNGRRLEMLQFQAALAGRQLE